MFFDTVGHTLLQIQSIGDNFVETGLKLIISYSLLFIVLLQHYYFGERSELTMDNLSRPTLLYATEPSESGSDGETGMF